MEEIVQDQRILHKFQLIQHEMRESSKNSNTF